MKGVESTVSFIVILVLSLVFPVLWSQAQESEWLDYEFLLEQLLEMFPDEEVESVDVSEIMERWSHYMQHPLDLNSVNLEDLLNFGFLSPLMAGRIIDHRNKSGEFLSVLELQSIEGLDQTSAQLLAQVLRVRPRSTLETVTYQELLENGEHELILRHGRVLQQSLGFSIRDTSRSRYLGSPDRILLRYRYQFSSNFRVVINMEKDPGEAFFSKAQPLGFDHLSAGMELRDQGVFERLILGDYVLQFGQGLGIWTGFSSGAKGALLHGIARQGAGLKLHTSADEIHFFRGLAGSARWGSVRWTPFISFRQRDASISEDNSGQFQFASLGTSGLHRTPSEVANKGQVDQWTYGMNAERGSHSWKAGATVYHSLLNAQWRPQEFLRNQFAFRGNQIWNGSGYYQFNFRNIYFFGEMAIAQNGKPAFLNGFLMSLHPQLSLGLQHRNYSRAYHAFFAQAAGESGGVQNERGLYVGLQYQPNRRVSWILYADFFQFPWIRYRIDAPSTGVDLFTQFTYTWSRRTHLSIRFRHREKAENVALEEPENVLAKTEKSQLRLSFDSKMGDHWRIRTRLETIWYGKEWVGKQYGWMVFQDLFYQAMGAPLSGNLRIARFNTTGYDSRIYAFENDVLYASSFPMYHNQGWRAYLNLRWRVLKNIDFWSRFATFRYGGREPIGSGLDLIEQGRYKSEIKTQLRFKF